MPIGDFIEGITIGVVVCAATITTGRAGLRVINRVICRFSSTRPWFRRL
jgi:hypothetical protein